MLSIIGGRGRRWAARRHAAANLAGRRRKAAAAAGKQLSAAESPDLRASLSSRRCGVAAGAVALQAASAAMTAP